MAVTIAEFPLALFLLLFITFFPGLNLILFASAYAGLQLLTQEGIDAIAMSDTLGLADNRCKNLLERYNNPLLTLFHRVKVDTSSAYKLEIIADNLGTQENYCVLSGLPLKKRPDFKDNRSKIVYLYRLQINSTVSPFSTSLAFLSLVKLQYLEHQVSSLLLPKHQWAI